MCVSGCQFGEENLGRFRPGHASPENFEISYLLEYYFLRFQEQLKMYFTKKIKLSLGKLLKFSRTRIDDIKHGKNIFHSCNECL